jgi:hypothetical protein
MVSTEGHSKVIWRSPDYKICNNIDHILVDRRHCVNVCDFRSVRGAEIESDHFKGGTKLGKKNKRSEKNKKNYIKKCDVGKVNKKKM